VVTTSASTLILCGGTVKQLATARHCPIDASPQDIAGGTVYTHRHLGLRVNVKSQEP